MQQATTEIGQLLGGIAGEANVVEFIDAQEAATAAIANALKSSVEVQRAYQFKLPLALPEERPIGKPALEKEQKEAIRDFLLSNRPSELGLSHRTWSIQAVRDYIAVEYDVDVSPSSVRNYIKQWGLAAPAPLNRKTAQQRTALEQDWMVEQFSKLKTKTKAAGQRMIWLSAKQATGPKGVCTVVHAVSNANRKTSWLSIHSENRMGGLSDLFDSMSDGFSGKPLVLFDESISDDFKAEIQAFLAVKHSHRKDGGGKTKKKHATLANTQIWLMSILGLKADFWAVMMHDDFSIEEDSPEAVADKLMRNERSWWRFQFQNPNEQIATILMETCAKELVKNPVTNEVFEDAFDWMTGECEEERTYRWCSKVLGLDPDNYRVKLLSQISNTPMQRDPGGKKLAMKRKVALHFIQLYN